jgi:hypothetical protein
VLSRQQRHRLVFIGSLLIGAALGCADGPPSVLSAAAPRDAREDSVRLGTGWMLEPLLAAVRADPSCEPSSSECPTLVSVSPGYRQGADQPEPIEIRFSGPVWYIGIGPVPPVSGALYCLGTFGTAVAYGADGTELTRADLELMNPADCGTDNLTAGAEATLRTNSNSPIARLVILPMSPLTFPVFNLEGRAKATYSVTYGGGPPPPPVPPQADPPCDRSSSLCPTLVSVSPGYVQGADQTEPIELTFTGHVGQIRVRGMGALSCGTLLSNGVFVGTFGSIIGYDASGTRIGSVDLRLGHPWDCGADKITYGALGTLNSKRPIARAVILPMSPLTFPGRQGDERASATYSLEYGVGSLPPAPAPPPPPLSITAPDLAWNTNPGVCTAAGDAALGTFEVTSTGASTVAGSRSDALPTVAPFPVGVTTITWTATAADGRTATAAQTVTVSDNEPPSVASPPDVSVSSDPGLSSAAVNAGVATAKDNCPGATVAAARSDGRPLGDPYPVGTTVIAWTATDISGNSASAAQTVTVIDVEPPELTVPGDFSTNATMPSGAVVMYNITATDNVGVVAQACSRASGATFPIGATAVSCSASDAARLSTTRSFNVTVRGAREQLVDLIALVSSRPLPSALNAQLMGALRAASMDQGKLRAACQHLDVFIGLVRLQAARGNAVLRPDEASRMIEDAARIRAVLGCG